MARNNSKLSQRCDNFAIFALIKSAINSKNYNIFNFFIQLGVYKVMN